jgi:acyl-CoA thioesterase-1
VTLIPFFLEGVAGDDKLNQDDRIHPNIEGTKIVADTVYKYLKPMLEKDRQKN